MPCSLRASSISPLIREAIFLETSSRKVIPGSVISKKSSFLKMSYLLPLFGGRMFDFEIIDFTTTWQIFHVASPYHSSFS